MSTYNKASLVLIPSGSKTSKIYSQKPTNGDGDFSFSRTTSATRVNQSGLIEKETQNLVLHSSNQNDAVYNIANSLQSKTAVNNPLTGNNDAFKIVKVSGSLDPYLGQEISTSVNGCYTGSMYLWTDSGQSTSCEIFLYNSGVSEVYTKSLTITTTPTRYEFFVNFNSTGGQIRFRLDLSTSTDAYLYTYGWQLEQGLAARDYIETTTSAVYGGITDNVPRIDYTDASCPSLLLEPTRTNTITASEYFDGGSLNNTTISADYNTTDTLSPEGVYNAAKLTATGSFPRYSYFPTIGDNVNVTISCFAKAGTANKFAITGYNKNTETASVFFNLSTGVAAFASYDELQPAFDIEDYGNGWYRCWISYSSGSGATAFGIRPFNHAQGETGGWTGSNYIYAYGAQMEQDASYPTSYIPTYGTSVTRNIERPDYLDVTNLTGSAFTIFLDYKDAIRQGSTANWMYLFNTNNQLLTYVYTSTLMLHSTSGEDYTYFTFGDAKVAFVYDGTNVKYFLNGTLVKTVTASTRWNLGAEKYWLYSPFNNSESTIKYNSFIILKEALTDQEAINLTTT